MLAQAARAAVAGVAWQATETDLADHELVAWLKIQMVVEGPTAGEALSARIRDEPHAERFLLYGRIDPDSVDDDQHTFRTSMLNPYDPSFDYSEWIDQSMRQTAARLLQDINLNLTIGEVLGGYYLMRAPLRARLLERRGDPTHSPRSSLVWAEVPILSTAPPSAIAAVAQDDETVAGVRASVRHAFRGVNGATTPGSNANSPVTSRRKW